MNELAQTSNTDDRRVAPGRFAQGWKRLLGLVAQLSDIPFLQFLVRAYAPHLALLPILLLLPVSYNHELELPEWLSWFRSLIVVTTFLGIPGAWVATSLLLWHGVAPPLGWIVTIPKEADRLVHEKKDAEGCFLWLIFPVALYLFLFCLFHLPILFFLLDLGILTGVLLSRESYARYTVIHRERGRLAALGALDAYYRENDPYLRDEWPQLRFRAELRVRIPPTATADQAWQAAREFLNELQREVQSHSKRHTEDEQAVRHGDEAVEERIRQLREEIVLSDQRIAGNERAIHAAGANTPTGRLLQRQRAALHNQREQRVNELNGLLEGNPGNP